MEELPIRKYTTNQEVYRIVKNGNDTIVEKHVVEGEGYSNVGKIEFDDEGLPKDIYEIHPSIRTNRLGVNVFELESEFYTMHDIPEVIQSKLISINIL